MPQWRVPAGMGFEHLEMEAAQVPLSFPFFLFVSLFLSSPITSSLHLFIYCSNENLECISSQAMLCLPSGDSGMNTSRGSSVWWEGWSKWTSDCAVGGAMEAGGTLCPFWWGQGHFHRMLESEDFSGRLSVGGTPAEAPRKACHGQEGRAAPCARGAARVRGGGDEVRGGPCILSLSQGGRGTEGLQQKAQDDTLVSIPVVWKSGLQH